MEAETQQRALPDPRGGGRRVSVDEQRVARWLDWLRDGSDGDKIAARRGLAGVFKERGMVDEAIELLERNVEAGAHGAETLRWLSRLYEARDRGAKSVQAGEPALQHPQSSLMSVGPNAVEMHPGLLPHLTVGDFMTVLATVVSLGVTLGTGLWMLTPLLTP